MDFYQFQARSINGERVSMDSYRNNVVLVVNTASQCGLTPQYEGLEALYHTWKDKGFVVLGFPCNQFGKQEPGSSDEIAAFCQMNYGVTFPMFERVEVNGANAHPLFVYLKDKLPGTLGISTIKWNFTKFLLDAEGRPVERYAPVTPPDRIESRLKKLLGERA
ncbi:MAG: glutathione peroxidase [Bacteroidetes bacterium HLUCCA01]|nr:MAG: glutathione peroxidase [Bacteroidetes bacterium HLUCCA01]